MSGSAADHLCRLCAETKQNFIGIYDPQGVKLGIESKIYKCLQIQVVITDDLPLSVCIDCCLQLDQCNNFYDKSNEAQNSLNRLLRSGDSSDTKHGIVSVGEMLNSPDLNYVNEKSMGFTKQEEEICRTTNNHENDDDDDDDDDDEDDEEDDDDERAIIQCQLNDNNYINNVETVVDSTVGVGYFNNTEQQQHQQQHHESIINNSGENHDDVVEEKFLRDNEKHETIVIHDMERENDDDDNGDRNSSVRINVRNNSESINTNKQNIIARKRLKRSRNTVQRREKKIHDIHIDGLNSDLDEDYNNELEADQQHNHHHHHHHHHNKVNVKIPDNYMTGTESDVEMIEARAAEPSKPGRKRGEGLNRYPWLCTDCNDKLPSLKALEVHHDNVHNQKAKFMCVQCCKVYDKYYGFLTHVKRHKNKSKFSCQDCGKSFVHKKVLESHKAIHSEERPHVCQTCGKSFRQQSALYIHSRCHLPDTMKNRYQCDQCDKRFSTKPNLVTHKRIHSGVRNFTCDQCGKSFIQKGNLEAHFLTHSADKPYNCSQCPKAFKTPLQLKKHETVHTGAKPHQCAVCGRTFREKGTLREHHRIHTGAMPFTCEFCGKCFRFKGILTTHRRQHTGERPYSCLECQHHFTNWPNYNKHMKRRHGINTSHTKHLQQQPQQQQQQDNSMEDPLAIVQQQQQQQQQQETGTSVQVIQVVPHASTISQPIVVQTIPTTAIQNFQNQIPVSTALVQQEAVFRDRNSSSNFYNAVPTALQNFLPPNLPYNFYNISNVGDSDLIQHR